MRICINRIPVVNNLFKEEFLCTGEILFVPRGSDYHGVALSDAVIIVHYFNNTVCHTENCILSYTAPAFAALHPFCRHYRGISFLLRGTFQQFLQAIFRRHSQQFTANAAGRAFERINSSLSAIIWQSPVKRL